MIIAIDSGTTNTRITLFDNEKCKEVDRIKLSVGARDNVLCDGKSPYRETIKKGLCDILKNNGLCEKDIEYVAASGMICSELGLMNLPHSVCPIGAFDLKSHTKTVVLDDISAMPITFIPGVKNKDGVCDTQSAFEFDMMRGEETELFGIISALDLKGKFTAVLPGSHNKIIEVGDDGKILKCTTALSGELMSCVLDGTIIKKALPDGFIREIDEEYLVCGYEMGKKLGLTASLFKIRCMNLFSDADKIKLSSVLRGIVASSDLQAMREDMACDKTFVVGGSEPQRSVYALLLKHVFKNAKVLTLDDDTALLCTTLGVCKIMEQK